MYRLPMLGLLVGALAAQTAPDANSVEAAGLRQLLTVHRVFVDRMTGGETAAQMRDILISSLASANLFILTEDQERADVILRGAAEDLVFTEEHSGSDNISVRANVGTGKSTSTSRSQSAGVGLGEGQTERASERRHEAIAAVRLVNKDGDVIWSTTQESLGAKFRGASADVADKITARLKEDLERARKLPR
jgi:hypothetical protein